MQDNTSLTLCGATLTFGFLSTFSLNAVVAWVAIIAGLTTIIYNCIRIYKEAGTGIVAALKAYFKKNKP